MGEPQKDNSVAIQPKSEITSEQLREKIIKDPSFLPTHEDIFRAFNPEGYLTDNYKTYLQEDWLSLVYREENPVFELLNKEYIDALGNYLSKQAEDLSATVDNPITILEVCAGNGRLTHFLRENLEQKIPGKIKMYAIDSGESEGFTIETNFPVEKLDHKTAIEKYKPQIILCSWMPMDKDLSADFRTAASVKEYILSGYPESCGDEWSTYGLNFSGQDEYKEREGQIPPYEIDGFKQNDLDEVHKYQISRVDKPRVEKYFKSDSYTISFKREK